MNWEAIGAIGEILGAIAVVSTLFYLAMQIRAANAVQVAESRRSVHTETGVLASIVGQSIENSRVFRLGLTEYESLNLDEQTQFMWMFAMLVGQADLAYADKRLGLTDQQYFEDSSHGPFRMLRTSGGREYWALHSKNYTPPFRDYVNREVFEGSPPLSKSH